MMMMRSILIGLTIAMLAVPAAGGAPPSKSKGRRMTQPAGAAKSGVLREWKGVYGGMRSPAEKVVRTQAEWAALWRRTYSSQVPPPAAPKVDFSKEMVLAVFMGERPTGGHSIAIEGVTVDDREIRARVRERRPSPDSITTQALTQPFHLVVIKRSPLPVRFTRAPVRG